MKNRFVVALNAGIIASALAISAVSAQDATPEVTPSPESTPAAEAAITRPFLGIAMNTEQELNVDGVLLTGIADDSPAEAAGLQPGDVIIAIDGDAVTRPEAIAGRVGELAVGDTVTLDVLRDGEPLTLVATLVPFPELVIMGQDEERDGRGGRGDEGGDGRGPGAIPDEMLPFFQAMIPQNGRLGVSFITLDAEIAAERGTALTDGALITAVTEESPAAEAGLLADDIVTAVNDEVINAEITLRDRLIAYEPGDTVTLTVSRGEETLEIAVTLGEQDSSMMEMMPFGNGRRGLEGLLPPNHPDIPVPPVNPGNT